jgi:hypothetical protein
METIRIYGSNFFVLPGIGYQVSGAAAVVVNATTTTVTFAASNPTAIVTAPATVGPPAAAGQTWAYLRAPINTVAATIGDVLNLGASLLSVVGASISPDGSDPIGGYVATTTGDTAVIASDGTFTLYQVTPPEAPPVQLDLLIIDGARINVSYPVPAGAVLGSIVPDAAQVVLTDGNVTLANWGGATEVVADLGTALVRFIKRAAQCVVPVGVALPIATPLDAPSDTQVFGITTDESAIVFNPTATAASQLSVGGDIEYTVLAIAAGASEELYDPQIMVGLAFVNYQPHDPAVPLAPGQYTLSYADGTVVYTSIVGVAGARVPLDAYYFGTGAYPPQIFNDEFAINIRPAALDWRTPAEPASIIPTNGVLVITPPPQPDPDAGDDDGPGVKRFAITYDGEFQFTVPPGHVFTVTGGTGSISTAGLLTASGNVTVTEANAAGRITAVYSLRLVLPYTIENLTLLDGDSYSIGGVETFLSGSPTYFTYNSTAKTIAVSGMAPAGQLVKYVRTDGVRCAALVSRIPVPANHVAVINTYIGEDAIVPAGLTAPNDPGVSNNGDGTYKFTAAGIYLFAGSPVAYKVVVSSKSDILRLPAVLGVSWSYRFSRPVTVLSVSTNGATVTSPFTASSDGLTLSIAGTALVVGTTSAILADGRTLEIDVSGPPGSAVTKYTHDYLVLSAAETLANLGTFSDYLLGQGQGLYECLRMTTASLPLQIQDSNTGLTIIKMLDIVPRTARLGTCSMLTDGGTRHFISNTVSVHPGVQTNSQNAFRFRPYTSVNGSPGMLGNGITTLVWERISIVWDGSQGADGVAVNLKLRDSFGNSTTKDFAPYIASHVYQFVMGTFSTAAGNFPAEFTGTGSPPGYNSTNGPYYYLDYEHAGFLSKDMNLSTLQDLPMGDTAMIASASYANIDAPIWNPDGTPFIRAGQTEQERYVGISLQIINLF